MSVWTWDEQDFFQKRQERDDGDRNHGERERVLQCGIRFNRLSPLSVAEGVSFMAYQGSQELQFPESSPWNQRIALLARPRARRRDLVDLKGRVPGVVPQYPAEDPADQEHEAEQSQRKREPAAPGLGWDVNEDDRGQPDDDERKRNVMRP